MKYILALFIMGFILSCKKEGLPVRTVLDGASNKVEGDIIWGGINSTHFINTPANPTSVYTYFEYDTAFRGVSNYHINMTAYENDTIIIFQIQNPDLHTPGVFDFRDLDSNHYVSAFLQSGYGYGYPPTVRYTGMSYSNNGRLTIDTISENHISGSIDAYCYRENLNTQIPDTNEVHLLFHFSGDLKKN